MPIFNSYVKLPEGNQFGPLYQGLEGKHLNSSILPSKHPICLTGLLSTAMRSSFWILENSRKKQYVEICWGHQAGIDIDYYWLVTHDDIPILTPHLWSTPPFFADPSLYFCIPSGNQTQSKITHLD